MYPAFVSGHAGHEERLLLKDVAHTGITYIRKFARERLDKEAHKTCNICIYKLLKHSFVDGPGTSIHHRHKRRSRVRIMEFQVCTYIYHDICVYLLRAVYIHPIA